MTQPLKTPDPPRALALDALRGLAILMMCLSGIVPEGLPNFMYHGYYPRFLPNAEGVWEAVSNPYQFRGDWPSFTWVDWVFPMFLFAMGAAFPLALGRRLDKGVPMRRVVLDVLWRGAVLIGFSVYVKQITPQFIEHPTSASTWCLGLLGFVLLFPVFTRLPSSWPRPLTCVIRVVGVASAVGFVVYLNMDDGQQFSFGDNDIIILLLAHMSIIGSLVWLATRNRLWLRLAALGLVYIAHDRAMHGGWAWLDPVVNLPNQLLDLRWVHNYLPGVPAGVLDLSVLYSYTWYKFLFVVIPGTMIGDLLSKQVKKPGASGKSDAHRDEGGSSTVKCLALAMTMAGLIAVTLVGLQCHDRELIGIGEAIHLTTPYATWFGVLPLLFLGFVLTRKAETQHERLLRAIFLWGALWLILGLAVEPLEGGIKKGPPSTLSYYFVSLALSTLLLGVLTLWIDVLGWKRGAAILVLNGQNPMLAYVGIRNLLAPLVSLPILALPFDWLPSVGNGSVNGLILDWLPAAPGPLLAWSLVQSFMLAVVVAVFTRMRIIWRT